MISFHFTFVVSVMMSNIYLKGGFDKSFSLIFGFSKRDENIWAAVYQLVQGAVINYTLNLQISKISFDSKKFKEIKNYIIILTIYKTKKLRINFVKPFKLVNFI